jgi:hypothetical protein
MNIVPLPGALVSLDELHCTAYDMWRETVNEGDPLTDARDDADAIVRVMAMLPARCRSDITAKEGVIRRIFGDSSLNDLLGTKDSADHRIVLSYAADCLALRVRLKTPTREQFA